MDIREKGNIRHIMSNIFYVFHIFQNSYTYLESDQPNVTTGIVMSIRYHAQKVVHQIDF